MISTSTTGSQVGPLTGEQAQTSREWFDRAKAVLAGGISSSARATTAGRLAHPLYIAHGQGSRIWDADGNEFLDFLLSYGSVILGHGDATLRHAVVQQLELGTMFGTCNTLEVELAEQICRMVPCAELVRYANSGSEAIMGAVRAARGFTGRSRILKFEGHYHGWVDALAISNRPTPAEAGPIEAPLSAPHSRGMPASAAQEIVIAPWNEPEILTRILDAHAPGGESEFAAMICEPIVANNACIMPLPGYLEFLREECTKRKIVLIFDEIVTGFRIAPGGAQEHFGVLPDLAVFSKAIGGGFPISAFCGRRDIMTPIGLNTVKHGGTYNGNPLCAAAALTTLRTVAQPHVMHRINSVGTSLAEAVTRAARDSGVACIVQGVGGMFQIVFTSDGRPPRHYRDLARADTARFAAFWQSLLDQRIHANSSGMACWFTSAAHTDEDVEQACEAIRVAMKSIS
ncbi:MAG: glutamate-1-semialdehyde 2,1-aminomutase [Planctomycetota bacterium]